MAKPRLYRGFVATNDSLSHAPPVNVLSITVFPGNRERLEERNKSNGGELEKGKGWNSSEREICLEGEESVENGGAEINFEEISIGSASTCRSLRYRGYSDWRCSKFGEEEGGREEII